MTQDHINSVATALVVGGGIGGMAAAISLAKRGVAVELIDLDPDWRVYGAGITITGVTLRAYRHLDMWEDIAEHGAITSGSSVFHFSGQHLRELDEPAVDGEEPATGGIMRPILHELMQERVRALNIPVRLGITVTSLENRDDGVDVIFSDGSEGRYDLVIGSDSVHSGVRKLAFPHMSEPERTGQGCWRISIEKPPMLEKGEMYLGHKYTVGITRCGENMVYLWLLTPHQRREKHLDEEDLYTQMKANLEGFGNSAGCVRDNMTREHWINYRPLAAKLQPGPWSNGRIVLLGDAVHATTPHLASGAGMAVESAIVLAEELAKTDDAISGLRAYEQRRFDRCRDIVESSIAIGKAQLAGSGPEVIGGLIGGALHRLAAPFYSLSRRDRTRSLPVKGKARSGWQSPRRLLAEDGFAKMMAGDRPDCWPERAGHTLARTDMIRQPLWRYISRIENMPPQPSWNTACSSITACHRLNSAPWLGCGAGRGPFHRLGKSNDWTYGALMIRIGHPPGKKMAVHQGENSYASPQPDERSLFRSPGLHGKSGIGPDISRCTRGRGR